MTYNTIMVQLDVGVSAAPRLKFAMDVARRFEADLIGFAAGEIRITVARDASAMVATELLRQQTHEMEEKLKALKEEFLSVAGDDAHTSWRDALGNPSRHVALHARAADLLIIGAPAPGTDMDEHLGVDPGTVVLSAGRPVLIAGDALQPPGGKTVLVAWKDGREARRAVVDAMPFLTAAREVIVAAVIEGDISEARGGAADVVRFLMRHGVKARSELQEPRGDDAAFTLIGIARQAGADLVVAGGYGHSRLREWAFGGMTRSLIRDGSVNRLLSN